MAVLLLGGLVLGLLASLVLGPHALRLQGSNGDPDLAARASGVIGDARAYQALAITEVRDGRITHAGLGSPDGDHPQATPTTRFQVGSITKTWNAMMLADAADRGEVRLDQPVSELLPELAGSPVASVTLEELATHRSGLPSSLPAQAAWQPAMWVSGRSPFDATVPEVLQGVRELPLSTRGKYSYSNLGASLLGHALARAAQVTDWPELVRQRIFVPLQMTQTVIATSPERLPADRVTGWLANGRELDPWCSAGEAPAGTSTWSTPEDMAKYAQALLDRRVIGMSALEPRTDAGPTRRMGLHWIIDDRQGHQLTWHNGSTQGGTSMLVLDRAANRAVMVFSASERGPETLARSLVTDAQAHDDYEFELTPPLIMGGLFFLVWLSCLATLAWYAWRPKSQLAWIAAAVDVVSVSVLTAVLGPWQWIPPVVFGAGCGLGVGLTVLAALRARGLPLVDRQPAMTWGRLVLAVAVLGAILGILLFLP